MNRMRVQKAIAFLALAGLLFVAIVAVRYRLALAQVGGPYDLSWSTIDGGGGTFSTGGPYSLGGTIGQPDPGLLAGGDYTLGGGFWGGGAQRVSQSIYLPVVLRSYGP
jgi:hypothetical protein